MKPTDPSPPDCPLPDAIGAALARAIESIWRIQSTTVTLVSKSNEVLARIRSNLDQRPTRHIMAAQDRPVQRRVTRQPFPAWPE